MRAEFITPADPAWTSVLERCRHDVYHLPGYLRACAVAEGGEPVAFLAEDGPAACLIPMLLRPVPASLDRGGWWQDAVAPYGYASPLFAGAPSPAQQAGFAALFRRIADHRCIISAFLRLHPLLGLPPQALLDQGRLVEHGQTIFLDLTQSHEALEAQVRARYRSAIRNLRRDGYKVVLDDWRQFDAFLRIYEETMLRNAASPFYFFKRDYFQALRSNLGERLHLGVVLAPDGLTVASAALFTEVDGIVQYHLGGTSSAHLAPGPFKLMLVHLRDWAKARGNHQLHLGGGVGAAADSLFEFKAGFSDQRATFRTLRMILDNGAYAQLTAWSRRASERKPMERRAFFPGYRRPAQGVQP
jgi:hypothetical protein